MFALRDEPIERRQQFEAQGGWESFDDLFGTVEDAAEGEGRFLFQVEADVGAPLLVKLNGVGGAGITETLVAMQVAAVESVQQVPQAIRIRTILVGVEAEIERIIDL